MVARKGDREREKRRAREREQSRAETGRGPVLALTCNYIYSCAYIVDNVRVHLAL